MAFVFGDETERVQRGSSVEGREGGGGPGLIGAGGDVRVIYTMVY